MAAKIKYGYTVVGTVVEASASSGYAARMEWRVNVGEMVRGDRSVDEMSLWGVATMRYTCWAKNLADYGQGLVNGGYHSFGLQPSDLPISWFDGRYSSISRQTTRGMVFEQGGTGSLEMSPLQRGESAQATLALVSKTLAWPDDIHMQRQAARARFDDLRDVWGDLDDFARVLWMLNMLGAQMLVTNPRRDYYLMPAFGVNHPDSLSMMAWYNLARRKAHDAAETAKRNVVVSEASA